MNIKLGALLVAGALALTACGSGSSSSSDTTTINVNGFSILEQANQAVFKDFQKTDAGKDVEFKTSYGASGDQSRGVESGNKADVVHYSLETDVTRLVKDGIVAEDWNTGPTKGVLTSSVVVLTVRKGNPLNITGWDDLIKPGVKIITPNPGSSGSARWNILAAWAHIAGNGGTDAQAKAFVTKLLDNTIALPGSGREATTAFTSGSGDVLISYENEAILAKASGADVDYVIPSDTLKIENTGAVTKTAPQAAKDFLAFQTSAEGQKAYAQSGFRPVIDGVDVGEVKGANDPSDPFPTPEKLFTIADPIFGGWSVAADKFFGDGTEGKPLGIITAIQQATGKGVDDQ
ncbi:sulfate ABC transporter substrate-binding protein [Nocardioides sp. Kera G14]|uniref:sulfate ABC transporter substrate-binding protein n=1 Tax=Nocardioides sp. Kera G14 TaxID=2884264 RepID=UPI001D121E79|nr:sulfate ABC transporter substrate-binding protein [Nocardioides sp. Kera G14]UDY23916.1 sulfate ABC transporter substrate-binding protein [Nocardioides sp. Kera G14]